MSQPTKQQAVRLPLDLHAAIVAAATENNRSSHAEMLHRLQASFSEPAPAGHTMVEAADLEEVFTKVFTTSFTSLEERIVALLEHPLRDVYSITIPEQEMSEEDIKALRASLKTQGMYAELSRLNGDLGHQPFDLRRIFGTASPTGRLSDTEPELQDLPTVSGMGTLAASIRKICMCQGGRVGFHTGGYTSDAALKDGEVPAILAKGEDNSHRILTANGWTRNTGECPVAGDVKVELLFRGGGENSAVKAGRVRWDRLDNEKVDISYWRLAK